MAHEKQDLSNKLTGRGDSSVMQPSSFIHVPVCKINEVN
jgi:hypothetical protein